MIKRLFSIVLSLGLVFNMSLAQELQPQLNGAVTNYKEDIVDRDNYIKVSLIDVVLETVSQSNNVKAAREKVIQSNIKLDDAYAGYLPSIDGTYKSARTETKPGDDGKTNKYFGDESYKLSVRQNIYAGGDTYTEIKSLEKKYEVAKNAYRLVIAKEIENAIKAYFDVLFNFNSLTVNIENMDRLQEVLEIVNIKYESGATTIGDLSSIKANVSNAESKLIKIQSKFNESLEYYKYIVGDEFVKTFPYEESFDTSIDDFDQIVQNAIENNINIKTYKLNIESQKYQLLNSKSGFKPKVDLELSTEKITDQEDFEENERNNKVQVVLSYNFYNKGRDKNKILTMNSLVRELNYRLKEEIRKLKWTLSKLHRSIVSVTNASVSTKAEVLASQEMVNAYWDGFKLGEQDLQELLQGQRQLNSAQLDLIENKKSAITDYFKLLSNTGDLLSYFKLNINEDNFIDFTRSDYTNLLKTPAQDALVNDLEKNKEKEITASIDNNVTENIDSNTTIAVDENLTKIEDSNTAVVADNNTTATKNSLDDLLEFESKFLESDDNKWTVRIYYFDKVYQALDFGNEKKISKDIFVFDTLDKNKIKTNIAYNIFDTEQLAQATSDDLNVTNLNKKVFSIKDIKELYNGFKNKKLQTKQKVKKVKPFQTNQKFKKVFLNAPKDLYTINITSFSSIAQAKELLDKEKIYDNSFVFTYGEENEWVKVMYGVFKTYEDANAALEKLEDIKVKYEPVIETITSKQELYKKYNSTIPVNDDLIIEEELQKTPKENTPKSIEENQSIKVNSFGDFQDRFLNAPKEYYTLNLATLYTQESGQDFYLKNSDAIDIFVFKFGQESTMYKAMGGIYSTYEEAQEVLEKLPNNLQKNKPRIEKIGIKQKLYFKYNTLEEN
ncbi:MAG: TolC family protein [Arcobacteraceae bacterium]|nr:TolC family protein [Arcobacteraceae bacterium]